jgi:hypothetical protein
MEIKYVDWGVASVYSDDVIELHKDLQLPEYSALHKAIVEHEKTHDNSKGFKYNFMVDFFNTVGAFGLIKFMLKRPKTWVQLIPLWYHKDRGFIYDKTMAFVWGLLVLVVMLFIKLIK